MKLAYAAARTGKCYAIVDAEVSSTFPSCGFNIVLSPDGRHVAWIAERNRNFSVLVDGHSGPVYDGIVGKPPLFQQDGTVAYLAFKGGVLYKVFTRPGGQRIDAPPTLPATQRAP